VPLLFVTIAGGAVAVMSADPAAEGPVLGANDAHVTAQPAKIAGGDRASSQLALGSVGSPDKPDQSAVPAEQQADPVAAPSAAQTGEADSTKKIASSGAGIASGGALAGDASAGNASGTPVKAQAADLMSSSLPADLPPPARSPAATTPEAAKGSASSPVPDRSARPGSIATGNAPLDRPQAAAKGSVSGVQRKVSTSTVKPDETNGANSKSRELRPSRLTRAEPITATSADSTTSVSAPSGAESGTQAVRKPVFANSAPSTAVIAADRPQTVPARPTKYGGEADHAARGGSDARGPLSVPAPGLPDRIADASPARASNARPPAAATQLRPNPAAGSSMWIGLASSSSESDARATLSLLQKQFPDQISASSIRRVDRGGDVLYRVRVGPLPLEGAAKVCSVLRAAGKNCILTSG
jgi:hypothetical protein